MDRIMQPDETNTWKSDFSNANRALKSKKG
jgi:hypothetical protein